MEIHQLEQVKRIKINNATNLALRQAGCTNFHEFF